MKTFKHIKNLPLEVSFQQVEKWVLSYKKTSNKRTDWVQKLLDKLIN